METVLMKRTVKLRIGSRQVLWEAMRRLLHVGEQPKTLDAILGLGSNSTYEPALEDGVMCHAGQKLKGCTCWFKLTDFGKLIIEAVFAMDIRPKDCDDILWMKFPKVVEIEHEA